MEGRQEACTLLPGEGLGRVHGVAERRERHHPAVHGERRAEGTDQQVRQRPGQPEPGQERVPVLPVGLVRLHDDVPDTHHEHAVPVVEGLRGPASPDLLAADAGEPCEQLGLDGLGVHPLSQPLCAERIRRVGEPTNSSRSRWRTTLPSMFLGRSVRGRNSEGTL